MWHYSHQPHSILGAVDMLPLSYKPQTIVGLRTRCSFGNLLSQLDSILGAANTLLMWHLSHQLDSIFGAADTLLK